MSKRGLIIGSIANLFFTIIVTWWVSDVYYQKGIASGISLDQNTRLKEAECLLEKLIAAIDSSTSEADRVLTGGKPQEGRTVDEHLAANATGLLAAIDALRSALAGMDTALRPTESLCSDLAKALEGRDYGRVKRLLQQLIAIWRSAQRPALEAAGKDALRKLTRVR